MPSSQKQIVANRQNALKSTGPKSVQGKITSKQNAITHGLLAKEILLASETSEESRVEYKQLLENLQQSFEPVGSIEEMLVELVAVAYWRLASGVRHSD